MTRGRLTRRGLLGAGAAGTAGVLAGRATADDGRSGRPGAGAGAGAGSGDGAGGGADRTGAAGGTGLAADDDDRAAAATGRVPFEGPLQAGIATPRPAQGLWVALDLLEADRVTLRDALQAITAVARLRTQAAAPEALTVTVGLGRSAFGKAGLRTPGTLTAEAVAPQDRLESARTGGDVLLQLCAASPEATQAALRALTAVTRGTLVPRWSQSGFHPASLRNPLGFVDGVVNPVGSQLERVTFDRDGSSTLVLRRIRTLIEAWDRTPLADQEAAIGRRKADAAPIVAPGGHVARARPVGSAITMLRRPFVYADGLDAAGLLDTGLVFCAFQRDPRTGFAATLERLAGEPLARVTRATGGGTFLIPPGVRGPGDWLGRALLD